MNIKILCVGKLKEQYLRDACAEYTKRLSRFADVVIAELPECRLPDSPSQAQIQKTIDSESESILQHIQKTDFVYVADVGAKQMKSEQFAKDMQERMCMGASSIVFVIGGSCGFNDSVRKRADVRIGFSEMTFPHQLFRVMLLEQVYRAFKIISGEKYHK